MRDAAVALVPELWPPPTGHFAWFASADGMRFGWTESSFHLRSAGGLWEKTLLKFPMTAEGWATAWQTLLTEYPGLAAEVSVEYGKQYGKQYGSYVVLKDCTLLGGYGWDDGFAPGAECRLSFTAEGLWVHAISSGRFAFVFHSPYEDALALEFSGPGHVTTGGRFFGGGFGVAGAAEGMIVASILNTLTSRTDIKTVIRYQAADLEAFFFYSGATPEDLRVQMSKVLGLIKPPNTRPATSVVSELEKLVELHNSGALSDDEFAALKKKIVESS